jgi:hypothetical protein
LFLGNEWARIGGTLEKAVPDRGDTIVPPIRQALGERVTDRPHQSPESSQPAKGVKDTAGTLQQGPVGTKDDHAIGQPLALTPGDVVFKGLAEQRGKTKQRTVTISGQ